MPAPTRRRPRRALVVGVVLAAAVLVYGTVVALYAADQQSRIGGACDPDPGAVVLSMEPQSVDAVRDRIAVTVRVADPGPLTISSLGYADPVTIIVNGADGDPEYSIPADSTPPTFSASLFAEGDVEQWPFDVHVATVQIVVVQTVDGEPVPYIPDVCASGQVSGWTLTADDGELSDDLVVDGEPVRTGVITATRSPATVAFGLVLLLLLVILPVLGLTVAIAALRGRRKVEATLMSWMAAMLFATVPLRSFLPGSPPVGSWVDYLVVLWVVAGLVAALVVYVLAWLRWTPTAGERPVRAAATSATPDESTP